MQLELTSLKQFVAIGDLGHITRAAESLGVSQPALSAMVRKLEAEVGAELLHRTGRGVELTEAGRVFKQHAEAAIRRAEQAKEAVRELAGLERGTIRLGGGATATAYLFPEAVRATRQAHPGLRVVIREAGSDQVATSVLSGDLDSGIVTAPVHVPGSADLMRVASWNDELKLVVPEGHELSGRRSFRWRDLEGEPVVGFEAASAVRAVIDQAASAAGVQLDVVMELRSIGSIRRMVETGIGVGFVSRFALAEGEGLTCRDGKITRELQLVRRRDRVPSAAAAALERVLVKRS